MFLPGKLGSEVAAQGNRSRKFRKKIDITAASNRKFNNIPKNDSQLQGKKIIKFTGEMKRELLDLAREREQESVSKWAVTNRGILALLAEGPLLLTSHSFPPLKIPDLLMDFQIK